MKFKSHFTFFALAIFILSSNFLSAHTPVAARRSAISPNVKTALMRRWVDSVFNTLSPDERIGQLFCAVVAGKYSPANLKKIESYIKEQHIGGILFSKGDPESQAKLTNFAQHTTRIPVLITCDGEWGLSMRLSHTTKFPRNMMLAAAHDDSLIFHYGQEVARECRRMHIHVNFAPDMDVNTNPDNPVIGTRSFGELPESVAHYGILYSKGLESGGVMAVAKHFPGHGNTAVDSHKALPVVSEPLDTLRKYQLYPFRKYIESGLSGMMIAHLYVPAIDTLKQPSSLSYKVVTDLLKKQMKFNGLVFTDGLQMKGVSGEPDYCVRALQAGNDILLGPTSVEKEFATVKQAVADHRLSDSLVNEKCRKILSYKYMLRVTRDSVKTVGLLADLKTPVSEMLARNMVKEAITLLKNTHDLLPLKHLDSCQIAHVALGGRLPQFDRFLRKYTDVASYTLSSDKDLNRLKQKLKSYNTLIISVHTTKNMQQLTSLMKIIGPSQHVIAAIFTDPYKMSRCVDLIHRSDAVLLGYENSPFSNEYLAQAIFGGNDVGGKLPVSVKGLFKVGDGICLKKVRLAYGIPEQVGVDSQRLDQIADIVQEGIDSTAYPGCQVLVAKNGVVIYHKAFGFYTYNRKQPVTEQTLYDLASMTKATATLPVIMSLYDKKKIHLNSPLGEFIPALQHTDKSSITVRQALLHESRLPPFVPYYLDAIDRTSYIGNLFSRRPAHKFDVRLDKHTWARTDYQFKPSIVSATPKNDFVPLADHIFINKTYADTIIDEIAKVRLRPRRRYLYSCLNFILLDKMAENIMHQNLNEISQNQFFKKLGATTTTFNPLNLFPKDSIAPTERDLFLRKQLLQGYVQDEGAAFMGGISGNAGLFSDANDLAKLYQMWLNRGQYGGERYLSDKTCLLFTGTKSGISRRGLGFDKPETKVDKPSPCSPGTPAEVYGHTGFTGTCFWIDPKNQLIYIFLSNRVFETRMHNNLSNLAIRQRIQEKIYEAVKHRDTYNYLIPKHKWIRNN